jgi:hypothetical protein
MDDEEAWGVKAAIQEDLASEIAPQEEPHPSIHVENVMNDGDGAKKAHQPEDKKGDAGQGSSARCVSSGFQLGPMADIATKKWLQQPIRKLNAEWSFVSS